MVCFLWGSEQWKVARRLLTLQSLGYQESSRFSSPSVPDSCPSGSKMIHLAFVATGQCEPQAHVL